VHVASCWPDAIPGLDLFFQVCVWDLNFPLLWVLYWFQLPSRFR
jgi:hypothetical protein